MDSSTYGKGVWLAIAAAVVSGASVFANGAAVKLADPIAYTTLKNLGALALLAALVLALNEREHFRGLSGRQWGTLVLIGIIGGSIPFALFFWGLKLGGPAVSSFVFRSLFLFAGLFGFLLLREKPTAKEAAAGILILGGNALLVSGQLVFGFGQLLVLAATMLWGLEYTISRKAMKDVHPRVVMVSRMLFGSIALLAFTAANGSIGSLFAVSWEVVGWLALTSMFLFGFLVLWYSCLRILPVFKAATILALGGVVTAVLDSVAGKAISLQDAAGLALIVAGVLTVAGATFMARAAIGRARSIFLRT